MTSLTLPIYASHSSWISVHHWGWRYEHITHYWLNWCLEISAAEKAVVNGLNCYQRILEVNEIVLMLYNGEVPVHMGYFYRCPVDRFSQFSDSVCSLYRLLNMSNCLGLMYYLRLNLSIWKCQWSIWFSKFLKLANSIFFSPPFSPLILTRLGRREESRFCIASISWKNYSCFICRSY